MILNFNEKKISIISGNNKITSDLIPEFSNQKFILFNVLVTKNKDDVEELFIRSFDYFPLKIKNDLSEILLNKSSIFKLKYEDNIKIFSKYSKSHFSFEKLKNNNLIIEEAKEENLIIKAETDSKKLTLNSIKENEKINFQSTVPETLSADNYHDNNLNCNTPENDKIGILEFNSNFNKQDKLLTEQEKDLYSMLSNNEDRLSINTKQNEFENVQSEFDHLRENTISKIGSMKSEKGQPYESNITDLILPRSLSTYLNKEDFDVNIKHDKPRRNKIIDDDDDINDFYNKENNNLIHENENKDNLLKSQTKNAIDTRKSRRLNKATGKEQSPNEPVKLLEKKRRRIRRLSLHSKNNSNRVSPEKPKRNFVDHISVTKEFDNNIIPITNNKNEENIIKKSFKNEEIHMKSETEGIKTPSKAQCPICLDTASSIGTLDPCGHEFCNDCINEWARVSNSCPCCKKEFKKILYLQENKRKVKRVKKKKFKIDEDEEDQWVENCAEYCMVCRKDNDEHLLLVCDKCHYNICHTHCAGLDLIPDDDFICAECKNSNANNTNSRSRNSNNIILTDNLNNNDNIRVPRTKLSSTNTLKYKNLKSETKFKSNDGLDNGEIKALPKTKARKNNKLNGENYKIKKIRRLSYNDKIKNTSNKNIKPKRKSNKAITIKQNKKGRRSKHDLDLSFNELDDMDYSEEEEIEDTISDNYERSPSDHSNNQRRKKLNDYYSEEESYYSDQNLSENSSNSISVKQKSAAKTKTPKKFTSNAKSNKSKDRKLYYKGVKSSSNYTANKHINNKKGNNNKDKNEEKSININYNIGNRNQKKPMKMNFNVNLHFPEKTKGSNNNFGTRKKN